jgi:flavin-binding protein dodecin
MADGVYRVTEVVGVSSESWEAAAVRLGISFKYNRSE